MATIEEKTVHTSNTEIRLYKEGAFWVKFPITHERIKIDERQKREEDRED